MSASVTYWRLPEEEVDLLMYLNQDSSLVASPIRFVDSVQQIVWRPLMDALSAGDDGFLIALPKFVPDMRILRVDPEGVCVNITSAPALLYQRGLLVEPNRLRRTTLKVNTSYVDEDHRTVIDLPAEYIRWGKRILQWARRAAPDTYRFKNFRITPKAEAARRAGMEMIL